MSEEEIVEKAKVQGWVPKEEWRGDPEKWRPADEFVERGENIIPILKDRIAKLEEDFTVTVKAQKGEIERVKQETTERARLDFEAKLAELNKRELKAVEDSDADEFAAVQAAKQTLRPPQNNQTVVNPVFEDWSKKNKWYGTDPELSEFAEFTGSKLANKGLKAEDFYKAIEERVRTTFPQKFTNPNRDKEDIAGSSTHGGGKGKKSWSEVPKKDQDAFTRAEKRVVAAGGTLKKEDWLKEYFSEE